jgi:hypothetical protein
MKSMCENMVRQAANFLNSSSLLLRNMNAVFLVWSPPGFDLTSSYIVSSHGVWNTGGKKVDVLLVGMNPGPFGMAQVWLISLTLL